MDDKPENERPVQVLFVDDEENILRSLKRLFMDEPFGIVTADSGEKGLEILRKTSNIGLIVSDQRMPGLSGVEFLEKAKNITPQAMRIVLTGYADVNVAVNAINKGGAYKYITKPWTDEDLVRSIKEAVDIYLLKKENQELTETVKKQNEQLQRWNAQLEYDVQKQTIEIQKKNNELGRLNESLKKNFDNSIAAFSGLMELRDKRAQSHSKNVAEIAINVAKAMELPDKDIEDINVAALLHDIGKIGISDSLLQKDPEQMNLEELAEYKLHPIRGQTAIDSIEDLRSAGILVRHHHEWFNGEGFPDRLKGLQEIPAGAMIIAMADFIDRTISNYWDDDAVEFALGKARKELGRRFDPKVYPFIEKSVKKLYSGGMPRLDLVEVEMADKDLQPGMILSKDARSGTGLLLLRKGTKLDDKNIQALKRYYRLDPSSSGVFVWARNEAS